MLPLDTYCCGVCAITFRLIPPHNIPWAPRWVADTSTVPAVLTTSSSPTFFKNCRGMLRKAGRSCGAQHVQNRVQEIGTHIMLTLGPLSGAGRRSVNYEYDMSQNWMYCRLPTDLIPCLSAERQHFARRIPHALSGSLTRGSAASARAEGAQTGKPSFIVVSSHGFLLVPTCAFPRRSL